MRAQDTEVPGGELPDDNDCRQCYEKSSELVNAIKSVLVAHKKEAIECNFKACGCSTCVILSSAIASSEVRA